MVVFVSTIITACMMLQTVPLAFVSPPMAQSRPVVDAREMTLVLPHPLRKGETAWLLVKVGVIGHDQLQIKTKDGRPLGTISPFGIRSGKSAGTYTIPVPVAAIRDGKLALRLSVMHSGSAPRAPTPKEVKSLRLLIQHKVHRVHVSP